MILLMSFRIFLTTFWHSSVFVSKILILYALRTLLYEAFNCLLFNNASVFRMDFLRLFSTLNLTYDLNLPVLDL